MVTVKVKKDLGTHNIFGRFAVGNTVDVSEEFYEHNEESLTKVSDETEIEQNIEPEKDIDIKNESENESEVN